jgi:hypothetical protein
MSKRKAPGSLRITGATIGYATSGEVSRHLTKKSQHKSAQTYNSFALRLVFCTDPPEGIRATPLDRAWSHWQASITGPHSSPYEGGVFYLHVQIPHSYPIRPPSVRFATKIFHPNISRHGDIGLDCIQHNWSLALTIAKVS